MLHFNSACAGQVQCLYAAAFISDEGLVHGDVFFESRERHDAARLIEKARGDAIHRASAQGVAGAWVTCRDSNLGRSGLVCTISRRRRLTRSRPRSRSDPREQNERRSRRAPSPRRSVTCWRAGCRSPTFSTTQASVLERSASSVRSCLVYGSSGSGRGRRRVYRLGLWFHCQHHHAKWRVVFQEAWGGGAWLPRRRRSPRRLKPRQKLRARQRRNRAPRRTRALSPGQGRPGPRRQPGPNLQARPSRRPQPYPRRPVLRLDPQRPLHQIRKDALRRAFKLKAKTATRHLR